MRDEVERLELELMAVEREEQRLRDEHVAEGDVPDEGDAMEEEDAVEESDGVVEESEGAVEGDGAVERDTTATEGDNKEGFAAADADLHRELNRLLHYESTLQSELSHLPGPSSFHDFANNAIRSNLILERSAPEEEETRLMS
ncbi:hypothetical protein TrRE_jg1522, partial [Triparma retinervis]